jgi:hypothetical protein
MNRLFPSRSTPNHLLRASHEAETARLRTESRLTSTIEAEGLVRAFVHSRWAEHLWPSMRITCALTLAELHDLGRLRREDGVRACCGLVRVPVIHEEVALALWEYLAAGRGCDGGVDEQDEFERGVAALVERERGEPGEVEERGGPRCVLCTSSTGPECRLPADVVREFERAHRQRPGGSEDGVVWQVEEKFCPCQKVYEDPSEEGTSEARGSETESDGRNGGMSASSSSAGSKISEKVKRTISFVARLGGSRGDQESVSKKEGKVLDGKMR